MITISESGMKFGPYEEMDIINWEKSSLYKSFGVGLKSVEFIYLEKKCAFCLLEAKTTAPNPLGPKGQEGFDEYIGEVSEKLIHTFDLFISSLLGRYADKEKELPIKFLKQNLGKIKVKFLLVVKDAKYEWLRPLNDGLNKVLLRHKKTWDIKVTVLNEEMALSRNIIH